MIVRLLAFAVISGLIALGIALGLILTQPPTPLKDGSNTLNFESLFNQSWVLYPPSDIVEVAGTYTATKGTDLPLKTLHDPGNPDQPILLMVHGSGWHSGQFDHLGRALADLAEVRIVTLRGHGATPERRGDVDYLGQLEDDLAAAVADAGERKVILLGHSSGGGLVVRMAGGPHGGLIDRAILLAPFLQYDAPSTRPNSGGWARPLTRRIIGLSMLNAVGIHALDHLTAIQFAMPRAVLDGPQGHMATTAYSWRLNQSYAPRRNWQGDVAKLPEFLLIAGAGDEAMEAQAYEPAMTPANPDGTYIILPGLGHLDIVDAPETRAAIRAFLQ